MVTLYTCSSLTVSDWSSICSYESGLSSVVGAITSDFCEFQSTFSGQLQQIHFLSLRAYACSSLDTHIHLKEKPKKMDSHEKQCFVYCARI